MFRNVWFVNASEWLFAAGNRIRTLCFILIIGIALFVFMAWYTGDPRSQVLERKSALLAGYDSLSDSAVESPGLQYLIRRRRGFHGGRSNKESLLVEAERELEDFREALKREMGNQ